MSYNLSPTLISHFMLGGFLLKASIWSAKITIICPGRHTTLENWHLTWKWWFPKNISSCKVPFAGPKSFWISITQYEEQCIGLHVLFATNKALSHPTQHLNEGLTMASGVKLESMGLYRGKASEFKDQETKLQPNFSEHEQHAPLWVGKSIFPTNRDGCRLALRRVGNGSQSNAFTSGQRGSQA